MLSGDDGDTALTGHRHSKQLALKLVLKAIVAL